MLSNGCMNDGYLVRCVDSFYPDYDGNIIVPTLQMTKMNLREGKQLNQSCTICDHSNSEIRLFIPTGTPHYDPHYSDYTPLHSLFPKCLFCHSGQIISNLRARPISPMLPLPLPRHIEPIWLDLAPLQHLHSFPGGRMMK